MTSEVFDTKLKTSLPELRLEIIDWKSGRSVRNERQLILVDPVDDDEDSSTDWSSKRMTAIFTQYTVSKKEQMNDN